MLIFNFRSSKQDQRRRHTPSIQNCLEQTSKRFLTQMVYYRGWVVCLNVLVRGRQKSRAKIRKNCGGSINRQRKGKKQGKNVFRTACSLIQISNYPTNVFPLPVKLPFNWSHAFIFPQSWFAFVAGKTPRGRFAISGKESCVDRYLQWW